MGERQGERRIDQAFDRFERAAQTVDRLDLLDVRLGGLADDEASAVAALSELFAYFPHPAWAKNEQLALIYKNECYEHVHGAPDDAYLGRDDYAYWQVGEAGDFRKNDVKALERGFFFGQEHVFNPATDRHEALWVVKWRWELARGHRLIVGIEPFNVPMPNMRGSVKRVQ